MHETGRRDAFVVSGRTARRLLDAPAGAIEVSLDLGLTRCEVRVEGGVIRLPDGTSVTADALAGAFRDDEDCIEIAAGSCLKVYRFDPERGKYYKLFQPFEDLAPTLVIAGRTMHTIVGTDPWDDAAQKVGAMGRGRRGACLDTCFGLGYSAQLLARAGWGRVVSCEVDPNVIECAAVNPWSRGALEDPRIEIVQEDVREYVACCPDGSLSAVFHDPPTVHLAGELYGPAFYRELARVLAPGGALYHYVGAPGARAGRDHTRGVMQRLREAGFTGLRRQARGVLASAAGAA